MDPSIYGKVGHKLAVASSGAVIGNTVDTAAKHGVLEHCLFQYGANTFEAIYVYCGQTISGSAHVQIDTGGTASVTVSGYVALMSAGLQALPGEYIWVRSTTLSKYDTA